MQRKTRRDQPARSPTAPQAAERVTLYFWPMSRLSRALWVFLVALCTACAEPPSKEMNQAQGAIDAARAAGAEQFAAAEFTAAVDALRRSEEAVAARDFRLALNHAIDSRE